MLRFVLFLILSLTFVSSSPTADGVDCGDSGATYDSDGNGCQFTCSPDGVTLVCGKPGCKCTDWELYYNTNTKKCSQVNCENMDCAGLSNQQFFKTCQSSSKDNCVVSNAFTADCRTGCMCKPGFCKKDGQCVPRQ